uniref:Uncharacterized protein n=1 Tax=Meloidogyne incognita TaxID=6306 RepID=A0A914L4P5_MELIC
MAAIQQNTENSSSRPVSAVDNQINNKNTNSSTPIIERRIATDGPRRKFSLSDSSQATLSERCVVVARQSDGFGLTVSGEHPLTVATLKPYGAAQLAGVREGDRILKVNGMLVSCSNFQEVIKMISGGYNLVLTLLGPARTHSVSSWDDELFPAIQKPKEINNNNNKNNGILIQQTPNPEQMMLSLEWQRERRDELFRMLNKERANLESLQVCAGIADLNQQPQQQQIEFGGGSKLERALCRINELEKQLNILSLLNAVTNGKKRQLNRNDKKRGSIESNETEKQSSKTFPPTSMRTTNNSSVPLRAADAAVGRVEPIRSWIETGGMHYVQADVLPIGDEEEEEEEDGGEGSEGDNEDMEAAGPFTNLQDLKTRPAHLTVFFTYLLNNANPSSLLFYLITDVFTSSNVKDMRRFAYELFSTFLIPGAPLQLPNISQHDIQAIDKILIKMSSTPSTSNQQQDIEQLRKLFIPTRTKAVGQINEQLSLFRRKKHLDPNFVEEYSQLESISRADHSAELRLSERILFRTLSHLMHLANPIGPPEFGNCERKTLALIISVATLIKVVMGLRTNHSNWEKLLDKCPTFLSQLPKTGGTSMFKMLGSGGSTSIKQKLQLKEHQFILQQVFVTVHCYQCREAVWGVNPQAYFCQNCDVVVHKNCTSQLIDHCWPQQQQKVGKGGSQQQQPFSGRSKLVAVSTTSLTSPARIPQQHYHKDSNVSSSGLLHHHYYPPSLLSTESVFSSPSLALTKQQQLVQKQHLNLLPSQKSSISLTPPINRSHHSTSASVVAMAGSSKESSSIDRHGNDLIPPELIDADATTNGGGPPVPAAVVRLQHQQQTHMESLDSGSSPPSSSAMLPPPVFSSRFERILPPDIPPSSAPPPPPPLQKTTGNGQIEV